MLPLEILLSTIELWIGSAAHYPNRVGVPVKVGIRFTPLSYIVSFRMHPLPARIQKFLTQRIELMVISVEEL